MATRRVYHSTSERIDAELRQAFHLQDLEAKDARVLLRMLDGRIPADAAEVQRRKWLRTQVERLARGAGSPHPTPRMSSGDA